MKVFIFELQRTGATNELSRQVLAIADDEEQAKAHVLKRFTGWHVTEAHEVAARPVHFVLGDLEEL